MTEIKIQQELNEIKRLVKQNYINKKEVLTSGELISYLNISESLLYKLTSNRLIPFSKPTNGTLFFLKDKILEWIEENSIHSVSDAEKFYQSYQKRKSR